VIWAGWSSIRGAGRVSPGRALLHSPIESVRLAGVEPRAYLREAALRAVRDPGAATLPRDPKSPKFREKSGG